MLVFREVHALQFGLPMSNLHVFDNYISIPPVLVIKTRKQNLDVKIVKESWTSKMVEYRFSKIEFLQKYIFSKNQQVQSVLMSACNVGRKEWCMVSKKRESR